MSDSRGAKEVEGAVEVTPMTAPEPPSSVLADTISTGS